MDDKIMTYNTATDDKIVNEIKCAKSTVNSLEESRDEWDIFSF